MTVFTTGIIFLTESCQFPTGEIIGAKFQFCPPNATEWGICRRFLRAKAATAFSAS